MDNFWAPPEEWYVKVNVHFAPVDNALANGNTNGVGVIIRDSDGIKLWGAMGPMPGRTEVQALLWGVQSALVHCNNMGRHRVHIESTNRGVYDTIRRQEEQIVADDLQEVVR